MVVYICLPEDEHLLRDRLTDNEQPNVYVDVSFMQKGYVTVAKLGDGPFDAMEIVKICKIEEL